MELQNPSTLIPQRSGQEDQASAVFSWLRPGKKSDKPAICVYTVNCCTLGVSCRQLSLQAWSWDEGRRALLELHWNAEIQGPKGPFWVAWATGLAQVVLQGMFWGPCSCQFPYSHVSGT